jgi:PadR family transcriptional regulator PadR
LIFQLGGALIDGCVLAALSKEDAYGYALTQRVRSAMDVSESTLYPVLRRMQKEGYLTAYDQNYQGRNRRYYSMTSTGWDRYRQIAREWIEYRARVEEILLEGTYDDQTSLS